MSPDPKNEKTPTEIRDEIAQTREELGDTVEALAEKTDVKAQAKAKVDDVRGKLKTAAPESPQEAQELAKQNVKPLAITAGVIALLVLWRLLRR